MALRLYHHSVLAMSCRNEFQLYADSQSVAQAAFSLAAKELQRIEALWSRYRPESIVSRINTAAGRHWVTVDDETAGLLDYAAQAWQISGGAFDITTGVLRRIWRFTDVDHVPSNEQIATCLSLIGWPKIHWDGREIFLPQAGMEIDFGGLGKEYAADRIATLWRERGLIGLINLGGDLVATGTIDEQNWRIGIQHPRHPDRLAAVINVQQGALATSGDYQRCLVIAGRRYCHILDPFTGWPVGELASVSVLAPTCLIAGTLATTAMLKGSQGEAWLKTQGVSHHIVPVDD